MIDVIRRTLRLDGPAVRLRTVRAPRCCGEAGRQAAGIANRILSAAPEFPLHEALTIGMADNGDLRIGWSGGPDGSFNRITVRDDHLFDEGVSDMEEAVSWIMGEELRRIAIVAADPGNEDPVWGATTSPIIADMLATMRIAPDNPAANLDVRIMRAVRQRGGAAELQMRGRHVTGRLDPRPTPGRPSVRAFTGGGELDKLFITTAAMPDTLMDALPGRPLSAVVDLGPASADMTVASIDHDGEELILCLTGPATTVLPVPDGIERRWIELLGGENASA